MGMGPMQHSLTTATPFKSQKILFKARALGSNLIHRRLSTSTLETNPIIEINKFPIKHASTSKSLGVHIDGNLSWECYINEISK